MRVDIGISLQKLYRLAQLLLLAFCLSTNADSAEQLSGYTVQGKPVTRQEYDAAKLHDEGLLLMRSNSNEQAIEKFKQSISVFDSYAEVHHSLGVAYAKTGHTAESVQELKRAIELNPNLDESWFLLAGFYQAAGNLQESVNAYHEYLRRFPNSQMASKINITLGLLYAKLGKSEDAISELKRSIETNPDLAASWITLGGVYQAKGDLDNAIDTYTQYLAKFPKDPMYSKITGLTEALKEERSKQLKGASTSRLLEGMRKTDPEVNADKTLVGAPVTDKSPDGSKNSEPRKGHDDYLESMVERGVTRWPRSRIPISVYINDGSKVAGYKDSFRIVLKRSFEDWSRASAARISVSFVDKPESASLKCYWTDKLTDLKNPSEAGEARVFVDQNGINNVEIWFLTQPISKSMPLTDNVFRVIALHEVGHALGLSGHTKNPDDIMFYSTTFKDSWRELSGRDSRSIMRLYQTEI